MNDYMNEALTKIEQIISDSTCECDDCLDIAEILQSARLSQGREELRQMRMAEAAVS